MLTLQDIAHALPQGRRAFDALQALYDQLPPTLCRCDDPGVCCRFMPEMTFLEALQWFDAIAELSPGRRKTLLRRFVSFYLVTPLRQPGCPFLKRGGCSIYSRRPFACRAYGLWSRTAGQARTRTHRDGKRKLIRDWRRLGIEVPDDAVALEMDYCTRVKSRIQPPPSDQALMEVLARVYALDDSFGALRDAFEAHCHSDFSYLLAALLLGARKAVLGKMAVVKEIAEQETDQRLHKLLEQVNNGVLTGWFGEVDSPPPPG